MTFVAVLIAQILDPIRIVLLAIVVGISRLTTEPVIQWGIVIAGILGVSVLISQAILGNSGQFATFSTGVGFVSNAVIVGVILGVIRIFRR